MRRKTEIATFALTVTLTAALATVVGCATAPEGYTEETVPEVREQWASTCWWCGDYNEVTGPGGATPTRGTTRICGPKWNPRWSSGCPTTTTLTDGSVWQLQGACACDG